MIYDDIVFDQSLSLICNVGPVGSTETVLAEIMDRLEHAWVQLTKMPSPRLPVTGREPREILSA